ncbi:MAG: DUF1737 domain-containing protein [Alphaproteobacteria bacterium]|nr:DUF1737 domain-containing protein [Alphaproteobacteria bacterium]
MAKYDENKAYIVIEEEYRDTFEDEVIKWLQKGYLPLGGVSTHVDNDGYTHYCQALLKPAQEEN